ncbi:hypothetical protein LXL04_026962 [Taraxacum kok-saghyz]
MNLKFMEGDEDYVCVRQTDVVDGIACSMAAYLLSINETNKRNNTETVSPSLSVNSKKRHNSSNFLLHQRCPLLRDRYLTPPPRFDNTPKPYSEINPMVNCAHYRHHTPLSVLDLFDYGRGYQFSIRPEARGYWIPTFLTVTFLLKNCSTHSYLPVEKLLWLLGEQQLRMVSSRLRTIRASGCKMAVLNNWELKSYKKKEEKSIQGIYKVVDKSNLKESLEFVRKPRLIHMITCSSGGNRIQVGDDLRVQDIRIKFGCIIKCRHFLRSSFKYECGYIVRKNCSLQYKEWRLVPLEDRLLLRHKLTTLFDIDVENKNIGKVIDSYMARSWRNYQAELHKYFKEIKGLEDPVKAKSLPPSDIRPIKDSEYLCDMWCEPKYLVIVLVKNYRIKKSGCVTQEFNEENPGSLIGSQKCSKNIVPCYSGSSECCLGFNHFSDILGILRGLESSTVANVLIPSFMPPLNESLDVLISC